MSYDLTLYSPDTDSIVELRGPYRMFGLFYDETSRFPASITIPSWANNFMYRLLHVSPSDALFMMRPDEALFVLCAARSLYKEDSEWAVICHAHGYKDNQGLDVMDELISMARHASEQAPDAVWMVD